MAQKISLADWQQQLGRVADSPLDNNNDTMVYSTDKGKIEQAKPPAAGGTAFSDGVVRLRRETKGRGGKTVLTITGLAKPATELAEICAALKKKCACGGAVKDGIIEIQADKRQIVEQYLTQSGFNVKWAGG